MPPRQAPDRAFERELLDNPYVMNTISFTSYLKHLNRVMTGQYAIPQTRGLILLLSRYITAISASVVGGLLILVFASFVPIVYFGILVSLTLFATAVGSLVVLPVILSLAMSWSGNRVARKKQGADAYGSTGSR